MIGQRLTPNDLAQSPKQIGVDESGYDHNTQTSLTAGRWPLFTTFNGTQTFDHMGKPHDSDND